MTPDDLDTLVYDLRTCNNAARRKRLLEHWRAEHIAQEATIAHLQQVNAELSERCDRYDAMWKGAEDRAQAMEEELRKINLTCVKD